MPSQERSNSKSRPTISKRLTELLDERFLTHRELASALDVHEQQISRWVRGETGPYQRRLRQIAAFFDVAPGSLLDEEDKVAA